jgi:phosphohistidine phosphatase
VLIWIIRHGKAEKQAASGRDEDRELTGRGRRQAAHLGAEFAGRDDAPGVLISSPFARARQTAEGVSEVAGTPVEIQDALESGRGAASVFALIDELASDGAGDPVALVGHNPELSQVVAAMAGPGVIEDDWVKTGQAVGLELDVGDLGVGRRAMVIDVVRLAKRDG